MPIDKLQQQFAAPQGQVEPEKADPSKVLEAIARYNEHGKTLRRNMSLQDVALKLAEIAELAEQSVLGEADDWFDAHTLKRNMKEIKGYSGEFQKLAKEADLMEQRMVALYDDMGRILERYFEIPESMEPEPVQHIGNGLPQTQEEPPPDLEKSMMEADAVQHTVGMEGPKQPAQAKMKEGDNKKDMLTLRAIKAVHEKLCRTNPELANRFAKLPPKKMREAVWKLIS